MGETPTKTEAESCFLAVEAELSDLAAPFVQPFADPHSAAVTALLVAEYLGGAELAPKLEALGKGGSFDPAKVSRLRTLARALLHMMNQLGGDWFPELKGDVGDLRGQAVALRDRMLDVAERRLHDPSARLWIEAIRKGAGDVDLLIDLRSTARLSVVYAEELSKDDHWSPDARPQAEKLADQLEAALIKAEAPEKKRWREQVVRGFTLFVPVYDDVCRAGRFVASDNPRVAAMFPLLPTISRARRHHGRTASAGGASLRPPQLGTPSTAPPATSGGSGSLPAPPTTQRSGASVPPSTRRHEPRVPVEMELGLGTESNFYQGFTENLSAGGVFVATYRLEPIGTQMSVKLELAYGATLEVHGVVRWIRTASAADDCWPGMGIQFESLTPDQESKIREFLKLRDPLFFDDELA